MFEEWSTVWMVVIAAGLAGFIVSMRHQRDGMEGAPAMLGAMVSLGVIAVAAVGLYKTTNVATFLTPQNIVGYGAALVLTVIVAMSLKIGQPKKESGE